MLVLLLTSLQKYVVKEAITEIEIIWTYLIWLDFLDLRLLDLNIKIEPLLDANGLYLCSDGSRAWAGVDDVSLRIWHPASVFQAKLYAITWIS